ncbi:MAG TPA: hypothetical protein PKC20_09110, partial [Burkholderiaceae bacterium]|nr:hypothetical protein [Burkholderiaceae bacterium]
QHFVHGFLERVDGIDFALCNPRPAFDLAMVETAREAGADVRERTSLVDVRWTGGRATGVRVLLACAQEIEAGLAEAALGVTCDRTSNGPHLYYPNPKG